jgi:hypothetical protein
MASYTLQGFTNDASSADLDATNLNEMDNAIKIGHDFADSASPIPSAGKAMVWPENTSDTFTPYIVFGGNTTGITYSLQVGKYVRIGNIVYINIRIVITSKGSATGPCEIRGLPINCGSTTADRGVFTVDTDGVIGTGYPIGYANRNTDTISLYAFTSGRNSVELTDAAFTNNSCIILSGFYFV